ncbi:hypothetical protein [Kribbella italica]|uniref:Uncharacterized protein n=1 Tax=Kribbella italica TaxID=1540520 RepID=A0A7W9JEG7_9ACTN|nr:hypothetical protein [Kribbella italica]MBB5840623.1 hypothetical protein [Kribbella italica]
MKKKIMRATAGLAFAFTTALISSIGAASTASAAIPPRTTEAPATQVQHPIAEDVFFAITKGEQIGVRLPNGTKIQLYCYFDNSSGRYFFAKILEGRYEGGEGDVDSAFVKFETVVPECKP